MDVQPDIEKRLSPAAGRGKRLPLVQITALSVLGLVVVCLGLWMLVFKESGLFAGPMPNLTATALAANDLACKKLVEQAMSETDKFCKDIGTNQLCYGNFSIDAELADGASEKFSQRGDVIDVDILRRLSAAPLDLVKQAWGIAVFKVTANLPRSLPGQTITLLVFGNTTLNKDEPGLQTFYFFSDTGQVICDAVPFDGLLISMPDGVGARFNINGSELVLTGTASITANLGGEMNISLYDGSAQVTANGETQVFGAGEQVSIPLGGENGLDPVGPPSEPIPLSDEDLALACTMTGENCDLTPIPTVAIGDLQATLEAELNPTTTAPAATQVKTATAQPSPTSFPTATLLPPVPTRAATSTRTRVPNPTATRGPSLTPSHTLTPSRTFTPSLTRTFTPTLTPSLTRTFTPTGSSTFTPTFTPTASNTFTPTFTSTASSTFTPTFTPTASNTFTQTFTPTSTNTATATNTPSACAITLGTLDFSTAQELRMSITNNSGETITLDTLNVIWVDIPSQQRLSTVHLDATELFNNNTMNTPPSSFAFSPPGNEISNGSTVTLILGFDELLNTDTVNSYTVETIFNICTISRIGPP